MMATWEGLGLAIASPWPRPPVVGHNQLLSKPGGLSAAQVDPGQPGWLLALRSGTSF